MEKLRISVYWEDGTNEEGKKLISFLRDDLIDIQEGIIDEEEDINIKITKVENNQIIINTPDNDYVLNKEESVEFDCWTGYYSGVSSDNQYFFIISWKTNDILKYEDNKFILHHSYLREEL